MSFFKEQVSAEVTILLNLKAQYKSLTGKDFKAANSGGKNKGNKQEKKQEKKAEKKEPKKEPKASQDERAVKKITRFVLHLNSNTFFCLPLFLEKYFSLVFIQAWSGSKERRKLGRLVFSGKIIASSMLILGTSNRQHFICF